MLMLAIWDYPPYSMSVLLMKNQLFHRDTRERRRESMYYYDHLYVHKAHTLIRNVIGDKQLGRLIPIHSQPEIFLSRLFCGMGIVPMIINLDVARVLAIVTVMLWSKLPHSSLPVSRFEYIFKAFLRLNPYVNESKE